MVGEQVLNNELGEFVGNYSPTISIAIGPRMKHFAEKAPKPVEWYPSVADASQEIREKVKDARLILIKGSRGMALERMMRSPVRVVCLWLLFHALCAPARAQLRNASWREVEQRVAASGYAIGRSFEDYANRLTPDPDKLPVTASSTTPTFAKHSAG